MVQFRIYLIICSSGYCGTALITAWWRHQMEIFSALLALCGGNPPVTGRFPSQRPVTRIFDVSFGLLLNKRLSKQSRRRWIEMPSRSSWRHCNVSYRNSTDGQDLLQYSFRATTVRAFTAFIQKRHITINSLRPRQNGRHFADDVFKRIFLNENGWISLKISLKFVPKVPINNIPALVQIMAWRRPGDKPLSEPMMVRLPTHICVTRLNELTDWFRYPNKLLNLILNWIS